MIEIKPRYVLVESKSVTEIGVRVKTFRQFTGVSSPHSGVAIVLDCVPVPEDGGALVILMALLIEASWLMLSRNFFNPSSWDG